MERKGGSVEVAMVQNSPEGKEKKNARDKYRLFSVPRCQYVDCSTDLKQRSSPALRDDGVVNGSVHF